MAGNERSYGWSDPDELAQAFRRLPGLEFLRRMMTGELPRPGIQQTLAFRLVEVSEGRAVFQGRAEPWTLNPAGGVHGAWYAALLDSCMGCAVHSTLPAGWGYTTLEYKINLVRGATPDAGELIAQGRTLHRGRSTATAEGSLVGPDGRLYAHGSTTCLLFPPGEKG